MTILNLVCVYECKCEWCVYVCVRVRVYVVMCVCDGHFDSHLFGNGL